jgi:Na+-translocating ferredoxin:NAD+ oxidoreductase subunit D
MLKVMLALIPGIVAHAWLFGPGIWVSLLLCSAVRDRL